MSTDNLIKVKLDECALLVIDMQSDFISEGAPLEGAGGRDIIPNIKKLIQFARSKNVPVIYTKEVHRPQKIDYGMEFERNQPQHCLEGTPGAEIVNELTPEPEDYVLCKRRYSSFYLTDLEILLKGLKRNSLIISGVSTNVCVYAAALDAQQRDHHVIVVKDCVAGTSEDLHEAFLRNIELVIGEVLSSDELITIFS